jgi:hypothetical protein
VSTTVRVAAAACLSSALLLTACGGSGSGSSASGSAAASPSKAASQVQGLPAEQVLEKARVATASAKSLHYTADGSSEGQKVAFDVRADKARGVIASVDVAGQQIKIIQDLKDVYIGGNNPILTSLAGGKDAAGKWVKTSADNPSVTSILEVADPAKLTAQFFKLEAGQKVSLGTPKTVAGQQTVALVISGGKTGGGTMYVAAEGTPYPLLIESADKNGDKGTLTFSEFDKPVEIKVPDAKDILPVPAP